MLSDTFIQWQESSRETLQAELASLEQQIERVRSVLAVLDAIASPDTAVATAPSHASTNGAAPRGRAGAAVRAKRSSAMEAVVDAVNQGATTVPEVRQRLRAQGIDYGSPTNINGIVSRLAKKGRIRARGSRQERRLSPNPNA